MSACAIIKRDAFGRDQLSYRGLLHERAKDHICVDATFALDDRDLGYMQLRRGDNFREWFFRDRWYNIFRVRDGRSGALKGWYCNITRPPIIEANRVIAEDLCLDVFVYPDGRTLLLDEEEFAGLALDEREEERAWGAVDEILCRVKKRLPPFDEIAAE